MSNAPGSAVLTCALILWLANASAEQVNKAAGGGYPGERTITFQLDPEARVHVNAPEIPGTNGKALLVYFALPNGNTIEQTVGKTMKPGDDWRYNIQHIGAQTRFLRKMLPHRSITIAYLEASQKSWPAWRKKHGDGPIPDLLARVAARAGCSDAEVALNGHSGGGSLIFGYINALDEIPASVVRIAFLDSNYAYDREAGHPGKLVKWLQHTNHFLCVLAYDDASALLDGKAFVSAAGGTWGRSHAMWKDLAETFPFQQTKKGEFLSVTGLDGRIQLVLIENPNKKILHTVQVERNGFIHSMVCGTAKENAGYEYFGEPAWRDFVADD
jgi:hypothetical protein